MCPAAHSSANEIDPMKANSLAGVSEASAMVNLEKAPVWVRKMTDFDEHAADMVAAGIDMAVIWPPPLGYYYWAEPSAGAELARMVNEYTAGIVRSHNDRFRGLAVTPLQNAELAAEELAHAVRNLGLSGVAIASNVNGKNLDEEDLLPFFEQAERLDAPVFIHPDDPAGSARMRDYYLTNFLGYPLDTALAACHLVFGGVLDRFPNLKICLVHAGGVLPFLLGRLEHGQSVRPEAREKCKHPFPYYLKNFYVDTVAFRPEILRFVLTMMPEGHVFMGTDYPFDMADPNPVSFVRKAIPDDESLVEQVLGGNLCRLLRVSENG
jgi:aminocarboxymuconate-semialdehyde decarboxylase